MDDIFTRDELLIIDVALTELIWSLDDELDAANNTGYDVHYNVDEDEYSRTYQLAIDAEGVLDIVQEILEEEYVNV